MTISGKRFRDSEAAYTFFTYPEHEGEQEELRSGHVQQEAARGSPLRDESQRQHEPRERSAPAPADEATEE